MYFIVALPCAIASFVSAECKDFKVITYTNAVQGIVETKNKKRFHEDDTSGTVLDKQTGLMWYRCVFPARWSGSSCIGTAKPTILPEKDYLYEVGKSWHNAFMAAEYANYKAQEDLNAFAGYTDWRIPTINELSFIVNRKCPESINNSSSGFHKGLFKVDIFLDSNGTSTSNNPFIWSSTPDVYSQKAVSKDNADGSGKHLTASNFVSYVVNYKNGMEDRKSRYGEAAGNETVYVILVRRCKQGDARCESDPV
jgi:hypothetical protein